MLLPCYCHVIAMLLSFFCLAIVMLWPWQYVSSYSGLDLAWFGLASFGLVWFGLGWLWLLLRFLHRNLCGRSSSSHNSIHCKFRGFPDAAQSPLRHGCMHGATMLQLCRAIYAAVQSPHNSTVISAASLFRSRTTSPLRCGKGACTVLQ